MQIKQWLMCLSVSLVFSISSVAYSAPSISMVSIDGSSMVVAGSDFGTKAVADPLHFETFERGTEGTSILSGEYWSVYNEDSETYTSSVVRSSLSTMSAQHVINSQDEFYKVITELNKDNSKLFVSLWLRVDIEGSGWLDDGSNPQLKVMRFTNDGSYSDPPKMLWQSFTSDVTLYEFDQSYITAYDSTDSFIGGGIGRGLSFNGGMIKPEKGRWLNVQIQYQNAVAPTVTTIKWRGSYGDNAYQGVNYADVSPVKATGGPYLNTIKLGFHSEHADGGYSYWDDIYIDNSWSRIEIGDASVYDQCTHREMQVPTSWSESSLTAKINTGSFERGATAYIFVVDSSGNPSDGYQITIGGTDQVLPPVSLRLSTE